MKTLSQNKSAGTAPQKAVPGRGAKGGPGRGAGRAPAPVPKRPALLRNRWYLISLVGVVLVAVAVIVVLFVRGGDDDETSAIDQQIAAAQQAGIEQDRVNLTRLSDGVLAAHPQLVDVLVELHLAMPVDGSAAAAPSAEQLTALGDTLTGVADDFAALPGGGSEYNVARNGFALSVDLLSDTVGVLQRVEQGETELGDIAFTLRDRALDAWSTAATQLDVITIDATGGHLHASLPIAPQGDEAPSTDEDH